MIKQIVLVIGTISFVIIVVLVAILGLIAVRSSSIDPSDPVAAAKKVFRRIERGVIRRISPDSVQVPDTGQAYLQPTYLESIADRDSEGIPPNILRVTLEEPVSAEPSTVAIAIATDRISTCRYSTTPNAPYESMPYEFSTTKGLIHTLLVLDPLAGQSYTYYVRCADGGGNSNTNDYRLRLDVAPESQGSKENLKWLRTSANRIVDEESTRIILRGVNIERRSFIWDFVQSVAYELRAIPIATGEGPEGWGATVVKLYFSSGPVLRGETEYISAYDEMISLANSNGAYVHLVYRDHEPNDDAPGRPDDDAKLALTRMAARYANHPGVIYGVQGEPFGIDWVELATLYTDMIDSVRAVHPKSLISVPGTQYGRYLRGVLDRPILRDNVFYTSHPYDDWETIQREYLLGDISAAYPIVLGEFGIGGAMPLTDDMEALLDYSEQNGIGWIAWQFSDEACPCLLDNRDSFTPSEWGKLVKRRMSEAKKP
ncbi:MAG: cellulase family glycosylhydrolase [Chloroflexi bacterium]|nr:cellulase family glycosylhydrolase [Chloroflexota bacterium]